MVFKISDKIVARDSPIEGKGVFAKQDIAKDDVMVDIEAKIVTKPTPYALQIDETHYLVADYIDNFINHSCD